MATNVCAAGAESTIRGALATILADITATRPLPPEIADRILPELWAFRPFSASIFTGRGTPMTGPAGFWQFAARPCVHHSGLAVPGPGPATAGGAYSCERAGLYAQGRRGRGDFQRTLVLAPGRDGQTSAHFHILEGEAALCDTEGLLRARQSYATISDPALPEVLTGLTYACARLAVLRPA